MNSKQISNSLGDEDEIVICPYNPVHTVPAKRMQYHLLKCRTDKGNNISPEMLEQIVCPFNAKHRFPLAERAYHYRICPDICNVGRHVVSGPMGESEIKGSVTLPRYRIINYPRPKENWEDDDEDVGHVENLQLLRRPASQTNNLDSGSDASSGGGEGDRDRHVRRPMTESNAMRVARGMKARTTKFRNERMAAAMRPDTTGLHPIDAAKLWCNVPVTALSAELQSTIAMSYTEQDLEDLEDEFLCTSNNVTMATSGFGRGQGPLANKEPAPRPGASPARLASPLGIPSRPAAVPVSPGSVALKKVVPPKMVQQPSVPRASHGETSGEASNSSASPLSRLADAGQPAAIVRPMLVAADNDQPYRPRPLGLAAPRQPLGVSLAQPGMQVPHSQKGGSEPEQRVFEPLQEAGEPLQGVREPAQFVGVTQQGVQPGFPLSQQGAFWPPTQAGAAAAAPGGNAVRPPPGFGKAVQSGLTSSPAPSPAFSPASKSAFSPATTSAFSPVQFLAFNPVHRSPFCLPPASMYDSAPTSAYGQAPSPAYGNVPTSVFNPDPRSALNPAPTYAYGFAPRPAPGHAPNPTYGQSPSTTYGHDPSTAYGHAPSTTYGHTPSTTYGLAPSPAYGHAPSPAYGHAPSQTYSHTSSPAFSPAPSWPYGSTPDPASSFSNDAGCSPALLPNAGSGFAVGGHAPGTGSGQGPSLLPTTAPAQISSPLQSVQSVGRGAPGFSARPAVMGGLGRGLSPRVPGQPGPRVDFDVQSQLQQQFHFSSRQGEQ